MRSIVLFIVTMVLSSAAMASYDSTLQDHCLPEAITSVPKLETKVVTSDCCCSSHQEKEDDKCGCVTPTEKIAKVEMILSSGLQFQTIPAVEPDSKSELPVFSVVESFVSEYGNVRGPPDWVFAHSLSHRGPPSCQSVTETR